MTVFWSCQVQCSERLSQLLKSNSRKADYSQRLRSVRPHRHAPCVQLICWLKPFDEVSRSSRMLTFNHALAILGTPRANAQPPWPQFTEKERASCLRPITTTPSPTIPHRNKTLPWVMTANYFLKCSCG